MNIEISSVIQDSYFAAAAATTVAIVVTFFYIFVQFLKKHMMTEHKKIKRKHRKKSIACAMCVSMSFAQDFSISREKAREREK